jgi:hypothetical protein
LRYREGVLRSEPVRVPRLRGNRLIDRPPLAGPPSDPGTHAHGAAPPRVQLHHHVNDQPGERLPQRLPHLRRHQRHPHVRLRTPRPQHPSTQRYVRMSMVELLGLRSQLTIVSPATTRLDLGGSGRPSGTAVRPSARTFRAALPACVWARLGRVPWHLEAETNTCRRPYAFPGVDSSQLG